MKIYESVLGTSGYPVSVTVSGPLPAYTRVQERDTVRATLDAVAGLESNWDGHGSFPVTRDAIHHALRLISILEISTPTLANPDITPTSSGTIALEWETALGEAYLEIGRSKFSFFARIGNEPEILREGFAETLDSSLPKLIENALFPKWNYTAALQGPVQQLLSSSVNVHYTALVNSGWTLPSAGMLNQFLLSGKMWPFECAHGDSIVHYTPEELPPSETATISQIALAA